MKIGNNAFSCCSGLKKVIIHESAKNIGCFAFQGCNKLLLVILPKSIEIIEYNAFQGSTVDTVFYVGDEKVKQLLKAATPISGQIHIGDPPLDVLND